MFRGYERILRYFPRYARPLVLGTVCVIASRLLMVYAPLFLGGAIRALERADGDSADVAIREAWWFFGVVAASGGFTYLMRRLLIESSRRMERDLKRDLFAHVERLPASYFDSTRTGDLISRLTSDVEAVRWSFGPGFMYVGGTVVLFPMVIWAMAHLSPVTTALALVPLLAIAVVVRLVGPSIMERTRAVQDRLGDLSARAQESFAGARVVRAYATQPTETRQFEAINRELVKENVDLARFRALLQGGLFALGGAAELIVLWYGGSQVIAGDLELGSLVPLIAYVGMLVWPMISVGWVVSALQRSAAAMKRIDAVMDTPTEEPVRVERDDVPEHLRGRLETRALTYAYPGAERPALADVSIDVPAGSTLAVVGPVGSGKSTLLRLLPRLYEPPLDTVFADGVDVASIPLERLRSAFAVVPQDAFLFSDTILKNLALGSDGPLDEGRAREAVRIAGLEDDIAAFPRGLQTIVGERGLMLSGGQKQRTTLARALLRESPILLLDDCLSAVDTHTEAKILDALRVEMRRRTVVVVAHRLSTIRDADQIVVLDGGRVVERGTHGELVAAGGWYARTWDQQRLEAELEDLA